MVAADQPFLEFSHANVLLLLFVTHKYLLSEEKKKRFLYKDGKRRPLEIPFVEAQEH